MSWTYDLSFNTDDNGQNGNGFGNSPGSDEQMRWQSFTAGGTSITQVQVSVNNNGASGNILMSLYNFDGSLPSNQIASTTISVPEDIGQIGTASVDWEGLTIGTQYAIVLDTDDGNNGYEWNDGRTTDAFAGQAFGKYVAADGGFEDESGLGQGWLIVSGEGDSSPPPVGTCDLSYPINAFTGQTVTLTFTGTNDTGDGNIWRIVTDDEGAGGLFDNGTSGIGFNDGFAGGTIKYRAPAYAKALSFNFTITNIDGSDNLTINDTIGAMIVKPNML